MPRHKRRQERAIGEFKYVSRSHSGLTIEHAAEGHRFSFSVVDYEGHRILSMDNYRDGNGVHSAREIADDAMNFAIGEARRLGLVD